MGQWEVRGRIFEEVGKELVKMEVSFSRGETLKGSNIKNKRNGLNIFYFPLLFLFYFQFIFFILFLGPGLELE